jgi:hypothetical protein
VTTRQIPPRLEGFVDVLVDEFTRGPPVLQQLSDTSDSETRVAHLPPASEVPA